MIPGNLFIVAAPSGAGKTTLVKHLLAADSDIQLSISHTTRAPRSGEINGHDYHFIDTATFLDMQERGEFLEWAKVHGNYYGTSALWLEQHRRAGSDVLLEIDWQGARQVRHVFPDAIGIFILPPSPHELERRLHNRALDTPEIVERRVRAATEEMQHVNEFDFAIINNNVTDAAADLCAIVRAARLRLAQQRLRHPQLFPPLNTG